MYKVLKGLLKGHKFNPMEWDNPSIRIDDNGNQIVGRPSLGFGNSNEFQYAGRTLAARPWTPELSRIKRACQEALHPLTKKELTFCLAGYYPEAKGIPHHSDTVPTVYDWVASCSLGGSRVFTWRQYCSIIKEHSITSKINTRGLTYYDTLILLEDGDVIIFDGHSQKTSTHDVPELHYTAPRINLTFRTGL